MANIKSQIKRNRQTLVRAERNKAARSKLKTRLRTFSAAVSEADKDAAQTAFAEAVRELDKAASKGLIHRNNAANKKSRMAKRLAAL